jgi:hypothetical protein
MRRCSNGKPFASSSTFAAHFCLPAGFGLGIPLVHRVGACVSPFVSSVVTVVFSFVSSVIVFHFLFWVGFSGGHVRPMLSSRTNGGVFRRRTGRTASRSAN